MYIQICLAKNGKYPERVRGRLISAANDIGSVGEVQELQHSAVAGRTLTQGQAACSTFPSRNGNVINVDGPSNSAV